MSLIWRYIFLFLTGFVLLVFLAVFSLADTHLHFVFCDVGQGDAALIYRGSFQILIDGGPDSSVLSCLSAHMPFWDREIEIVTMTHPQEDHFGGLVDVVRRYKVDLFLAPPVNNETAGFQTLKKEVERKNIKILNPIAGNLLRNGLIQIETIWPSAEYLAGNLNSALEIGENEKNVLGTKTTRSDLNEFSIVQGISYGLFNVLFTGDVGPSVASAVADEFRLRLAGAGEWEVLKVPHHGSKNGLEKELLEAVKPKLAVISVGKNNRYGHPHKETIELLSNAGVKLLRTDLNGEVEVVTDGKGWWVKSGKKIEIKRD